MGISWIHQIRAVSSYKMNKFLVVASSLVAAVYGEAEADPALLYGGFGYGLGLPYAYGAYAFGGKSAPCVNAANVPVPCAGAPLAYAGYPYAHGLYGRKKREAEAEPEADAFYGGYGYPYALGYAGYHSLGYAGLGYAGLGYAVAATPFGLTHSSNVGICTNYLGASVPCGRKKREAEADADAEAAVLYGGVAATNAALGHAVAYTPAGVTHSSNVGVCTN